MARRLLLAYVTLIAVVLLILEVPLGITYRDRQLDDLRSAVQSDAVVLATFAEDSLEADAAPSDRLEDLARRYTERTGGRVVVVDADGASIVDSAPLADGAPGRDFSTRPEITTALAGRVASGTRRSNTLDTRLLFVAVPVASSGVVHGAVRVTFPTSTVDERVRRNWVTLALIGIGTLGAATAAGLALARWVVRPLHRLEEATTALGNGALDTRITVDDGPPEVRRLAAAVNETAARLEQMVGLQESFVADASHQLRTPLTALRLRLELLEGSLARLPAAQAEVPGVAAALDEVARLSRLVDGLLALARAERAGASATAEVIDLARVVEARAEAWSPVADEEGVGLEVQTGDVEAGPVEARATEDRLAQILDNLIANAIEASPAGSTVTLAVSSGPAGPEIHILDRGPGLTDVERERVFDRFWRGGSGTGAIGGSGLGLAIVRKLVESDGGTVELRSRVGGGVDATVTLQPASR
ncbi:MAG: ATP-binding protein [Microthrixaceae bacterium]